MTAYLLGRAQPTARYAYPPVSPHCSNDCRQYWNFNQLSIAYALRLGLGPDLPWADEPSPGNLRFSAGRILTCLIVYSYRHSHFLTLQHSLRYTFAALGTLPYPCMPKHTSLEFGDVLSPVTFSAQVHSTSELLRIL